MKLFLFLSLVAASPLSAAVLYSNAGPITANETGHGTNMAGMNVSRSSTDTGTLYFKYFLGSPASNFTTEDYYASMNLYEGATGERLGVGNAWNANAYSAYGTASGDLDLNSSNPEPGKPFQLVRPTDNTLIVFRIDYQSGANDNVTVWLNPDLSLEESAQNPALKTTFTANATFNEIHLREGGGGSGWTYSDISIAENGTDTGFFAAPVPEPSSFAFAGLAGLMVLRRRRR